MPAPGIYYRDLGVAPDAAQDTSTHQSARATTTQNTSTYQGAYTTNAQDTSSFRRAHTLDQGPTESHALATADHDEKGAAQEAHGGDVKDLGWFDPKEDIPAPLVGGLDNETLWMLIRRFNKQMYHVKETLNQAPGNLDLNIADEDEFSPDKLRSTVERLYMTVILGGIAFVKHIARLRSWRETRRTSYFCAAYFAAWLLDMLVPLFSITIIALIAYPPSRELLFPPAPLALVSTSTGGVQQPKAGVLGSVDSATGASENHKGEAVEQEASNFFNSIAHIALASASGKHPLNEPEGEDSKLHDAVPDPAAMALGAADARQSAQGGQASAHRDKTKVPMETAMWNKMRPFMHVLQDTADTFERFNNALSPTPPFHPNTARLRLAGLVVPLLAVSFFITNYMVVKGATFGIGFGFFGDPVIVPGIKWLNKTFPNWQQLLELRRTLLKGVPTNAQLTLTLLRIGEANKAPLPPPPRSDHTPPNERADLTDEHLASAGADLPLGATQAEIHEAASYDPTVAHETQGTDIDKSKSHHHGKKGARVLGFFKSGVKGVIETALGADKLKATVGSKHAKDRLGTLPNPDDPSNLSGPVDFKARFHGKKGHLYIISTTSIPQLSFTTESNVERTGTHGRDDLHPIWSMAVADIKEIKKVGGFGWKAKLVIGWALDREIADGMEITDRKGEVWKITAMPLRDELFNRLIAMAGQKWESW